MVNFFLTGREVLVAYLLLWIYITVARIDFMILQKMYLVINKSISCKNWIKTHFSPKRLDKFLRNLDMLYNALYLIFLPIFKLPARAVNLSNTYLLVFTKIFISNSMRCRLKARCSKMCEVGSNTTHIMAKGKKYQRQGTNKSNIMCTISDDSLLLKYTNTDDAASSNDSP